VHAEPPPVAIPDPATKSHADYGKDLGITGIDWDLNSADPVDLWYLIEDNALLKSLRDAGWQPGAN